MGTSAESVRSTNVTPSRNLVHGFSIDVTNVYWTNYDGDTVLRCAISGVRFDSTTHAP